MKFSPDAKWIATGSLMDHTVRVWHSQLSLLGMFTNTLTHRRQAGESGTSATSSGSQKPYKVFSFALPENSKCQNRKKKASLILLIFFFNRSNRS